MFKRNLITSYLLLFLAGCATTPTAPTVTPGIYHRVEKGQTLWRISKIYNMDLDEMVRINRILDASSIEAGQLIFIPNRQKQLYPLYKSSRTDEDFIWPLKGKVIASFGQAFNNMVNKGINIQSPKGDQVVAARSGKVIFYHHNLKGFGKTVIIDHGDGFSTVYTKNTQVFVKAGQNVEKGTVISKAGSYLHFEIRKGHVAQNPYFYLP